MAVVGLSVATSWNVYKTVGLSRATSWNVVVESSPSPLSPCLDTGRCDVFQRVLIDYMIKGTSRVSWLMHPAITAPKPWSFQLQAGETANPLADDWSNVGPAVVNTFVALDQERRAFGKHLTVHYRLVLTDSNAVVYYSKPATVLGNLGMREWIWAREWLRQESIRLRQGPAGIKGFILKKRRTGESCPRCLDAITDDVLDANCPICRGTRFVTGYFRAMPCQYVDPSNEAIEEQRSDGPEGWSAPTSVNAVFLGTPYLTTGDVWVDAASDLRYHIDRVSVLKRVRGVPISLGTTMSQLPFANAAYDIPLEGT